jgi:hypothetical protein
MISWLVRATCATVLLGAVGYLVVAVPLGRRTLFEHGLQISRTEPAQELAADVADAAEKAVGRVKEAVEARPPAREPRVAER